MLWGAVDLLVRLLALGLLILGLLGFAAWAGRAAYAPGAWLDTDVALFRALNGIDWWPLTALLMAALNEPGPNYFALILLTLGYCWRRRPVLLPGAALVIAVALGLGLYATGRIQDAGGGSRPRPFVLVADARTPIVRCGGVTLIALRTADGPTATCDGSPADLVGRDWRDTWLQFGTFPGGHMRETTALCLVLGVLWPAARPYALAYALLMAFSRVHLGAHYPTDVLAGTLVGLWSASISLLGLDIAMRSLRWLHSVPPLGRAWDAVFVNRVAGRPDLDPLAARLARVAAYAAAANLMLLAVGFAVTSPRASQIWSVLRDADVWTYGQLTARVEPVLAPLINWALGPVGALYAVLAGATMVWARVRQPRRVWPTLAALAMALVLVLELRWIGATWLPRPPPFLLVADALVPLGWHATWPAANSLPDLHALIAGALAGLLVATWHRAAPLAHSLGLLAALASVALGVAWLTDALVGYLLGTSAAQLGVYAASQFAPTVAATESQGQADRAAGD